MLRSYDLHANAYVTKPVDFERFIGVVQQIDDFFVTRGEAAAAEPVRGSRPADDGARAARGAHGRRSGGRGSVAGWTRWLGGRRRRGRWPVAPGAPWAPTRRSALGRPGPASAVPAVADGVGVVGASALVSGRRRSRPPTVRPTVVPPPLLVADQRGQRLADSRLDAGDRDQGDHEGGHRAGGEHRPPGRRARGPGPAAPARPSRPGRARRYRRCRRSAGPARRRPRAPRRRRARVVQRGQAGSTAVDPPGSGPAAVCRSRAAVRCSDSFVRCAEVRSTDVLTVATTLASAAPVSVPAVPR